MNFRVVFFILLLVLVKNKAQFNSFVIGGSKTSILEVSPNPIMKVKQSTLFKVIISINKSDSEPKTITVKLQSKDKLFCYSKTIKLKKKTNQIKIKKVPKGTYQILVYENDTQLKERISSVINQSFYVHSDVTKIINL